MPASCGSPWQAAQAKAVVRPVGVAVPALPARQRPPVTAPRLRPSVLPRRSRVLPALLRVPVPDRVRGHLVPAQRPAPGPARRPPRVPVPSHRPSRRRHRSSTHRLVPRRLVPRPRRHSRRLRPRPRRKLPSRRLRVPLRSRLLPSSLRPRVRLRLPPCRRVVRDQGPARVRRGSATTRSASVPALRRHVPPRHVRVRPTRAAGTPVETASSSRLRVQAVPVARVTGLPVRLAPVARQVLVDLARTPA